MSARFQALSLSLLVATAGCSADPERMTVWAKEVIHVEGADEAGVDRVLARARSELQELDLRAMVAPVVEHAVDERGPESVEVDVRLTDALFGEKWLPRWSEGLEGLRLRSRLTAAVSRTPSDRVGHIQAEAVLTAIYAPEIQGLVPVARSAIEALVAELTRAVLEAAEEAGTPGQVTARESRPPVEAP